MAPTPQHRVRSGWVCGVHVLFLTGVVVFAHHPVVFLGLFLFFLGYTVAYQNHQSRLILREALMVAFFLGGLVVLGGMQQWWLQPLLMRMDADAVFFGALALTAVTDNAALTYLGSQGNPLNYANTCFAENEERSPWTPLHVAKGFDAKDSVVSIFYGCRSQTFGLGLREKFWREHVRDMLTGIDMTTAPCLLLDPITARQFIDRGAFDTKEKLIRWLWETGRMPAARYWDMQLVQNYIYPRATCGEEPRATKQSLCRVILTYLKHLVLIVFVSLSSLVLY